MIKSGRQSGPTQLDKHPVKPIELAATTEKNNEMAIIVNKNLMPTLFQLKLENQIASEHNAHCNLLEKISEKL